MPIVQYKCPNCGASLEFQADSQKFSCEYCGSSFTEKQMKQMHEEDSLSSEESAAKALSEQSVQQEFEEHNHLYNCPSCGAEIITDDVTAATFCVYCHSPVVLSGRLAGEFRPNLVLPFQLNREQALETFQKWCNQKWFLPRAFTSEVQLEKLTGIYIPFWMADCKMDADMHAIGKKIRSWQSGDYQYTETQEYAVHRRADLNFNGIPADGSSKTDDKLMEAIEPFRYEELKVFSMPYLSGFQAEKYDVNKQQVFPRIRQRAEESATSLLRSTIQGYNMVSVTSNQTNILKTDWNYVLLPVWMMTYQYRNQRYFFAMNGQTSKMAGRLPLSWAKVISVAFLVGMVTALICGWIGWWFLS